MAANSSVSLAELLDSLLQKSYHELTVLAELLPRKSDVDRKIGIVTFARQTRLQLVRLLALVKWASSSDSVQKCSEMSELLSQQSWLYEDTANQLVTLARHQLLMACMPNFSLAPALDILCTGSYPRLPSCIRDNIVPPSPLSGCEAEAALSLLTVATRRRLLSEQLPPQMAVRSIGKGVVVFEVPHEFRLTLSVVGDDQQLPWRLVNLEVLVGAELAGGPPLCHSQQTRFLTMLAQSHLVTDDGPLTHIFTVLHTFSLALALDCLHTQATQMISSVCGNHLKIEEYQTGRLLRVSYWNQTTPSPSQGAAVPNILVAVDPSSPSHPVITTHTPPLTGEHGASVEVGRVCLEEVIGECVRVRATDKLKKLRASLKSTVWEERAVLCMEPLCLRVCVPVRGGEGSEVVMGVDVRTGCVSVGVEPGAVGEGVEREVGEMERGIGLDTPLAGHLSRLQCQLLFDRVLVCVRELGLRVASTLPLPLSLPLPSPHALYVQLLPLTYLAVCASETDREVSARYYLVEVGQAKAGREEEDGEEATAPRIFHSVLSMAELDDVQLVEDSLRSIAVRKSPAILKRKLHQGDHGLPSTKRLCVTSSHVDFSLLPSLCTSHLLLAKVKASLKMSGIHGYQELWAGHGCPCVSVCEFPLLPGQSPDIHHCLSSHLLSCILFPSHSGHKLVMVLSPLLSASQAPDIILHHHLPLTSELGPALIAYWQSKLALLSMALELLHYLEDPDWLLSASCHLSHFGYDSLTISLGEHSLSLHGGRGGIQLTFSPESPHVFLTAPLQQCLLTSVSLPVLLKGVVGTEETLTLLHKFTASFNGATLIPISASQVQLQYHTLSLTMNILSGGCMEFTNLQFAQQRLPMSMPGIPCPLGYLKAFIHGFLGVEGAVAELDDVATPLSRPLASRLQPPPMPISSPSRSPLPSIPALPTPTPPSFPHSLPSLSQWSYLTSPDQLRSLILAMPNPPLMIFMASLAQLCHFWQHAAIDRAQPQPMTGQLQYTSTDRRVYHYRTETLAISLSVDSSDQPSLLLQMKPVREGCWSTQELQLLTDFWRKEVACPPFTLPAVVSYVKLLQLPLLTLKSCVQLIAYHLSPPPNLPWGVSLCMVIPQSASDEIPVQLKPGSPGVIYKGKLLLMIQLTHSQDGRKGLIPIMHDLRINSVFVARNAHQTWTCLISNIDSILKKVSQEYGRPSPNQESAIFPAVKALLTQSAPPSL